jgi:hypothetical protein
LICLSRTSDVAGEEGDDWRLLVLSVVGRICFAPMDEHGFTKVYVMEKLAF